jgi:RNA polymerase-binding transcription factor DksA
LRFELLRATFTALTADSANTTDRDRAVAALRMFSARAVIEEIEDAIVRIESGTYGTCQSCHRPISLERLETIPHARCCASCPAAVGPRLRQECCEEAGLASLPVRLAPHLHQTVL